MTGPHEPSASRASHDAYVEAIVAALADRGVTATDVTIRHAAIRQAEMTVVETEPLGTTWEGRKWARLRWDERHGWSWQVLYRGENQPRAAVYFGFSAVPQPAAVGDWMLICLAHPEATPSREDGPFTTPDLETVLRAYTVT